MEKTTRYYYHGRYQNLPKPGKQHKTGSGYRYCCFRESGEELLFVSHNFRSGKTAVLFPGGDEGSPGRYSITMRPSFPITGKMDLLDEQTRTELGIITRSRKVFSPDGELLLRFNDRRSWREQLGESVVDSIGNLIFSGDNSAATTNPSDGFIISTQRETVGTLTRERLPFYPEPENAPATDQEPGPTGTLIKKLLPKKLSSTIFDKSPPRGWKLEILTKAIPEAELLLLAGGLMTLELNRW